MRRAIGSVRWFPSGGTERQPGDDRARIEVKHGRDPITGKPNRHSVTVRGAEREVQTELARLMLKAGQRPDSNITLSDYLTLMWLPAKRDEVRERTADSYEDKIDNQITPKLGHMRLRELEPYVLDRWIADVEKRRSPQTALHAYGVLHNALRRAVKWRLIESNPLDAVESPTVPRRTPDVLSADEASAYLDAFSGHFIEPIVVLAIAAGLRRSELAALLWSDIDMVGRTVRITKGRHQKKGRVWNEPPKSLTSDRMIELPVWAVEILTRYRGLGPIVTRGGEAITPNAISDAYRRRIGQVKGLRYIPMKNLRHSHAMFLLAAGVPIFDVSRQLGHSTTAVTELHYTSHDKKPVGGTAEAIESIRRKPSEKSQRA